MMDVAKKAGVSINAVSLALRHDPQISGPTANRILRIASDLGYQKNPTVAHLMSELRRGRQPRFKATLALLNANLDRDAFRKHPTIPCYVDGCTRRARQMGYAVDEFWLHDPDWKPGALDRILATRNIRGAIVIGRMQDNRLPPKFLSIWQKLPCVVTGVRTREPTLSFACVDHHALALQAFEHAIQLGYRRPALVLDAVIDELVEGRFTAGFLAAQRQLPKRQHTAPFLHIEEARSDLSVFRSWMDKQKPDVILTLYNVVRRWVDTLGLKVPQDIGMIQLEWRKQRPDWAGMDQRNDLVGEAAVDMIISMIHSGERGIPTNPRATLIGSTWVEGATVTRPRVNSQ
jgi:DNA-binding LacI/PurR family transcriptional regulator